MNYVFLEKIFTLILGISFLFKAYFGVKSGNSWFIYSTSYSKEKEPRSFWLCVGRDIILGVLLIVFSVYALVQN